MRVSIQNQAQTLGHQRREVLLAAHPQWQVAPNDNAKLWLPRKAGEQVSVNLAPLVGEPQEATAAPYFESVETTADLIDAYHQARLALPMEKGLLDAHVHQYAEQFLHAIFDRARTHLPHASARLIARWVGEFDIYVAVKSVQSLLNSEADLALLQVAQERNWCIHFDHLAIRCGCSEQQDAEQLVALLVDHHGYQAPHLSSEVFYEFQDGWNAYFLFKILTNGVVLRLFIDQSKPGFPLQIIQHWNRAYGFTAHHLAMRATHLQHQSHESLSLKELSQALQEKGVSVLSATGDYTQGLLEQVFTRPQSTPYLPADLMQELKQIDGTLVQVIRNGKLLELVARAEVPPSMAESYYAMMGIEYHPKAPHHSCPFYDYFLPEQAAHVIRTSIETP